MRKYGFRWSLPVRSGIAAIEGALSLGHGKRHLHRRGVHYGTRWQPYSPAGRRARIQSFMACTTSSRVDSGPGRNL
jgi:hypothetical protein